MRSKSPTWSLPAASLAAAMCFSISAGDWAQAKPTPSRPATANAANDLAIGPPGTKNEERKTKNEEPEP
jgi:hypothetical protein